MPPPQQTYETALEHLLAEAGGVFAAADVAALMGISQAAVHNRVKLGRAIGFIRRGHLVLPKIQFVQTRQGTSTILEGVDEVLSTFHEAHEGQAAALQFLLGHDPNLDCPPIEALRCGQKERVLHATKAYLQLNEG